MVHRVPRGPDVAHASTSCAWYLIHAVNARVLFLSDSTPSVGINEQNSEDRCNDVPTKSIVKFHASPHGSPRGSSSAPVSGTLVAVDNDHRGGASRHTQGEMSLMRRKARPSS